MQETKTRTQAEEVPSSRPPWVRAVAIVAALALLGGVLYGTWQAVASNDDPEPDPIGLGESDPDFSLTDEQAIARFEELHTALVRAIQTRDRSLLLVATSGGPIRESGLDEIANLQENRVRDQAEISIRSATVVSNDPDEITLDVTLEVLPCFLDDEGQDVTRGPDAIEQHLTWTLKVEAGRWLIHSGVLDSDREVQGKNESC